MQALQVLSWKETQYGVTFYIIFPYDLIEVNGIFLQPRQEIDDLTQSISSLLMTW